MERIYGEDEPAAAAPVVAESNDADDSAENEKYAGHKKARKGPTADLYELIGLGHLRWQATTDEIKAAYRRTALEVHPDKCFNDDTLFKAVNAAFDTLGDAKKRRDYDSADPFDDALPDLDNVTSEKQFYKIFGAVFRNNAKWSKKTPVPDLGDADTPYATLEIFYTFWIRFQTWREFAFLNEYEPEQAESREEKRWMERQNAKLQQDKRKAEAARLTKLVDMAYARDPRILRRKQDQAEEKVRAKAEKAEEKRKIKEDAEKKATEEAAERKRAEEEAKVAAAEAKVVREKLKKVMRKKRQQLRNFGDANGVDFELVELICTRADDGRLDVLISCLTDIEGTKQKILDEVESYKSEEEKKRDAEERAKVERAAEAKRAEEAKEVKWSPEELTLLTKALARFPGGAVNRWESIATFMSHTKTEAEIIAKIKSFKTKEMKAPAANSNEDFQQFLRNKKDTPVLSPHSIRYEGSDSGPLGEGSEQPTPAPSAAAASTTAATVVVSAPVAAASPAPASAPSAGANASASSASTTSAASASTASTTSSASTAAAPAQASTTSAASAPAVAATPAPAAAAPAEWSADQQTALEAALKKFPSTTENRWDVIAAAVPGRTKKECVERFKYLVAMVKGGKK